MKTIINAARDFTPFERHKLLQGASIVEQVMNSDEFKNAILNHSFNDAPGFANTLHTNQEIYDLLMKGSEALTPGDDYEMDIDITIYTSNWFGRNTVGYTYPSTIRTWINRRCFVYYAPSSIAGNLAHEWCHKLGFDHDFYPSAIRPFSVPYAVGNIVNELGKKYEIENYQIAIAD